MLSIVRRVVRAVLCGRKFDDEEQRTVLCENKAESRVTLTSAFLSSTIVGSAVGLDRSQIAQFDVAAVARNSHLESVWIFFRFVYDEQCSFGVGALCGALSRDVLACDARIALAHGAVGVVVVAVVSATRCRSATAARNPVRLLCCYAIYVSCFYSSSLICSLFSRITLRVWSSF